MTRCAWLLGGLLLLASAPRPSLAGLQMFQLNAAAHRGRQLLAPNECVSKGLEGTCNGCVCCCFDGGAGIVTYRPTDTCQCDRVVQTSQIWATVVLSVILVVAGLLVQLYFGGSLPISPYKRDGMQQRQSTRRQPSNHEVIGAPPQAPLAAGMAAQPPSQRLPQ